MVFPWPQWLTPAPGTHLGQKEAYAFGSWEREEESSFRMVSNTNGEARTVAAILLP